MSKCPFTGVTDIDCGDCAINVPSDYFPDGCPILHKYRKIMEEKFELHTEEIIKLLCKAVQKD